MSSLRRELCVYFGAVWKAAVHRLASTSQAPPSLGQPLRRATTVADAAPTSKLRNFAIIAHVDHGKTTLMDRLLYHDQLETGAAAERVMDTGTFEKERGITITSKYTSFQYGEYMCNAVDTPGHADFGGEVERILGMVDGAVLVVDATEGAMAQTRFVLAKALALALRPIVVFNKVDRPAATQERCDLVHSELLDVFAALGADDAQLDFPVVYASGKAGWTSTEYPTGQGAQDMRPLLDVIVSHVPPPPSSRSLAPFTMLATMISHDNFLGRVVTGRVASGSVALNDAVRLLSLEDEAPPVLGKVTSISKRRGVHESVACASANTGDIVSITGVHACVGDTLAAPDVTERLTPGRIDPPTLSMVVSPNASPLGRAAGNNVTLQKIWERLQQESASSVSLHVRSFHFGARAAMALRRALYTGASQLPCGAPFTASTGLRIPSLQVSKLEDGEGREQVQVQARGELQLGILIEGMRRDAFEVELSAPQVVMQRDGDGALQEPLEEVTCEVPSDCAGDVIAALQVRKGALVDMVELGSLQRTRLTFTVPTRGLIGFKSGFTTMTRGEGILSHLVQGHVPYMGAMDAVRQGVIVSMANGVTTSYALSDLQARGTLFVKEGERVYSGMIVGESNTRDDLQVNPTREKKLSNVRSKGAEDKNYVPPPRVVTLEDSIGYIQQDERIEVTPQAVRMRKVDLEGKRRAKAGAR